MSGVKELIRWGLPGFMCAVFTIVIAQIADGETIYRLVPQLEVFRTSQSDCSDCCGDGDNSNHQDGDGANQTDSTSALPDFGPPGTSFSASQQEDSGADAATSLLVGVFGGIAFLTALGYMLSVIHHLLFNYVYPGWLCHDLRNAIRHSGIFLQDYNRNDINISDLSPSGAWLVVSVMWHANRGDENSRLRGAEWRSSTMFDILHGAGAAFIGACVAPFLAAYFLAPATCWSSLIAVLIFCVMAMNFRGTSKRAEMVTGGLLVAVARELQPKVLRVDRSRVQSWLR